MNHEDKQILNQNQYCIIILNFLFFINLFILVFILSQLLKNLYLFINLNLSYYNFPIKFINNIDSMMTFIYIYGQILYFYVLNQPNVI